MYLKPFCFYRITKDLHFIFILIYPGRRPLRWLHSFIHKSSFVHVQQFTKKITKIHSIFNGSLWTDSKIALEDYLNFWHAYIVVMHVRSWYMNAGLDVWSSWHCTTLSGICSSLLVSMSLKLIIKIFHSLVLHGFCYLSGKHL